MIEIEAVREFKRICEQQLNHPCTETEAAQMADRVIRFLLASEKWEIPRLSDQEQIAFDLIKTRNQSEGRSPSVREITQSLGLSSSRSGHRVVTSLLKKRLISRDDAGALVVLP